MKYKKLPLNFYHHSDVIKIAKHLLGKFLVTRINNQLTAGMIVETEAYQGPMDKASHAYNNRRTSRTETMYLNGGVAYIYLCYGIHHLFNVVTGPKNTPHAVLIRAIEPSCGIKAMLQRRNLTKPQKKLTAGPGNLSRALGITTTQDQIKLNSKTLWLEDRNINIKNNQIISSPRVGVDYAQEHAQLPWRFTIENNPWVSQKA